MKICGIITVFGASVVNPMPSGNITDSESVSQYAQNASLSGIKTQRRYQDFRRMFLDFYSREDLTRVSFSVKMTHFDQKWWSKWSKSADFWSKSIDFGVLWHFFKIYGYGCYCLNLGDRHNADNWFWLFGTLMMSNHVKEDFSNLWKNWLNEITTCRNREIPED